MMDIIKFAQSIAVNIEDFEIKLNTDACLRNYKSSKCDKCLKICPEQAITFKNKISLDNSKCKNCGLCLNACPTQAFSTDPSCSKMILDKIRKERVSIYSCSKSKQKNALTLSCVGLLNEGVLALSALKGGSAILVTDSCSTCTCGKKVLPLIRKKVTLANNLLKALGSTKTIDIVENPVFQDSSMTREKFFKNTSEEILNIGIGYLSKKAKTDNPLPENHLLLTEIIAEAKIYDTEPLELPFHKLSINDKCDLCFDCVQLCPTKAIRVESKKNCSTIEVDINKCIGCHLCVDICSRSALSVSNKFKPSLIPKTIKLIEKKTVNCRSCSRLMPDCGEELCSYCKQKKQTSNDLISIFE